jgi:ornithine decarboxylase
MQVIDLVKRAIKENGSPCLILSLKEIERSFISLSGALPGVKIYYALKANPHPAILAKLRSLGGYFDVSSNKEIEQVKESDITGEDCIHTHPIKTADEISYALENGINNFTIDNLVELKKFVEYKERVKLTVRLSIDNKDCRINLSEKFGCTEEEALVLFKEAAELGIQVTGLSFHTGSQNTNPERYIEALRICKSLDEGVAQFGSRISVIDIGGGFPVAYGDDIVNIHEYCSEISKYLKIHFADKEILAEPGRFLVAPSMTLLTTVKGKSLRNGKVWYFIDDSIYHSFSGIVFDHCDFPMSHCYTGDESLSLIAGSTCDSCDIIKRDVMLPELEVGDALIFKQMGAYCSASASFFNGYAPTQIVIDENFN